MRIIMAVMAAALFVVPAEATADGLIGGIVNAVVPGAGTKLDHLHDQLKKAVPPYGAVEGGASRVVRETVKWIAGHPSDAVEIAAVVAVGWAACVDGCTLVGSLIVSGQSAGLGTGAAVAIPLVAVDLTKAPPAPTVDDRGVRHPANPPGSSAPVADKDASKSGSGDRLGGYVIGKLYPRAFDHSKYPDGHPVITYKSFNEALGSDITNEFAAPTYPVEVRNPTKDDPASGLFDSPRNENVDPDAKFAIGAGARRLHAGTDFLAVPTQPVFAPMTGTVTWGRFDKMDFAEIRSKDGTVGRVLYISRDPNLPDGSEAKAGKTQLGSARDIHDAYPASVPNHVHVDFTDAAGRRFDPWTNSMAQPKPDRRPQPTRAH